jgi:hypothetical protein
LRAEQVSRYLDVARDQGFDGVLTISNQLTRDANTTPVTIDRRKTRRVGLWHLSWWQILTEAIIQHRHRRIADPDQAWILGELIAYLDHENSGASGFQDMGDKWVAVRDGARQGTLRHGDKELPGVCERWEQFVQFLCLGLSQDLGRDVEPQRPRKQTPQARADQLRAMLVEQGTLTASVRVPDAVAPLDISADVRARTLTTSVALELPRDGRPATRLRWALRQLDDAPADLRLTVGFANLRATTSGLLGRARERPEEMLVPGDPKREPRYVQVALVRPLGLKRGRGPGSFVGDTRQQAVDFYADIVQQLRAWRPGAPKLPREVAPSAEEDVATPEPPAFSLPYGRLPGDAHEPDEPPDADMAPPSERAP